MKRVHKIIRSLIFLHIENMFTCNECYIEGKGRLSGIFRRNHCWDWRTFAWAVSFFLYPCHRTLPPLWAGSARPHFSIRRWSRNAFHSGAFLAPLLQLFQPKPKVSQNTVHHGCLYICTWTDILLHLFDVHTLWPIDLDNQCQWGSALGTQKTDHCMQLAPGVRSEGELHH